MRGAPRFPNINTQFANILIPNAKHEPISGIFVCPILLNAIVLVVDSPIRRKHGTDHLRYLTPCSITGSSSEYMYMIEDGTAIAAIVNTSPMTTVKRSIRVIVFLSESRSFIPQNLDTSTDAPIPRPIQHML